MMAEEITRLTREVERVVTAPYVPSLQDLHSLIQTSALSTLRFWTLHKPCQVGRLAEVLLESLSRSRVALPLLAAFARIEIFRDVLLHRQPVLLDAFLEQALTAGESEYHSACIALLSSPLPLGFVLPARLAGFITKLVSAVAANPGAEAIAPLHALMTGLQRSPNFIYEVPTEVLSNLQLELTKTLRNLDDHMGNLLGLATFAQISMTHRKQIHQHHGMGTPSWLLNIQHFFGPKRGMKTLDLVVLRVILACSSNCNILTPAQAAESIRLAICIADAVEPDQKQSWLLNSSSKIAKLCEKVARENLNREIQVMGVTFLLSLQPLKALPPDIGDLGLRLLVSKDSRAILGAMSPELVSRLTDSLVGYDDSVVYEVLHFTVDTLKDDGVGRESMVNLHVSDILLSGFQANLSEPIITSLLNSASTKQTIAGLLGRFPVAPAQSQCQGSPICHCTYSGLQNKVLLSLYEIYFAAALSHDGDAADIGLMKSLLQRATKSLGPSSCTLAQSEHNAFRNSLNLRNRQDFTTKRQPIRDWRASITEMHMQNAETSHIDIMKMVEDICFDLERRCYDIESPVRSAEEERDRQKYEAEKLQQHNEDLTRQLDQSTQVIATLQQDLARLEEHAGTASTRAEELSEALELARQELRDQQHRADDAFRAEQERARSSELELAVISTEKDDQLEELHESLRQLESQRKHLEQVVQTFSHERATSAEATNALEYEIAELRNLLETKSSLCSQKEDEVKRLLAENNGLQTELGTAQIMVEDQNREIEQLYSKLHESEEQAKADIMSLNRDRETEIARIASEVIKHKEEHGLLQKAMQSAASDASKELQSKDKRIHQLEKKIQSLRDERAAKAREFSEAQQHIGRLMNVMGFSAKPADKSSSKSQHSRDPNIAPTPGRRQSTSYDDDDDEMQLSESFESLASNLQGPTPKRPKGNGRSMHPSQALVPKTPAADSSLTKTNVPKTGNRQPLTDAGTNNHVKSQLSPGSKGSPNNTASLGNMGENRLQGLDLDMDLEFSKDFLFTSTALSASNN
ncbi:hypothetical protein PMG11_05880 [Penicillium brasilianum]|uniref:Uncharacterized protein n=1 Tax=Penicillium brasilianum TaxID=104259 RepID=A0A0F7TMS1_PENBI|nr:hypothetical protein PMG11_05880 [Penicillium brasilianum]